MRINKYLALSTGLSRRAADEVIAQSRVLVNNLSPQSGQQIQPDDVVLLDGKPVAPLTTQTIILNKPAGYVVSRNGQGSKTIYDLLPQELHSLKPVGRLDKDSSGLLILTNDGDLANQLTHPRYEKEKHYLVELHQALQPAHKQAIERGVRLEDGISALRLLGSGKKWEVTMSEGRNRQIRRTFAVQGYFVKTLHRVTFGNYKLGDMSPGAFTKI
jgi:23S rRNA pseudouridine2605 synthase